MDVAQKAIDLGFDGLMLESHVDPDNAWSDAKQQVTPARLAEMLEAVKWRREDVASETFHMALDKLREQINHVDDELLDLLSQRMRIAERIGEYKRNNDVTILQTNRWNEILEKSFSKADRLGLSREFVTRYLDAVHMESINRQNRVMNG
jgi:chorismate mutase